MALMRFSIVIVTWNCAGALASLVESMNRNLVSEPELIVVDNASDDDPAPAAHTWRGPVRFVRNDANRGFGAACNVGLGQAEGEAIVFLNPDTHLLDDGLTALARRAAESRALVGPRVLESNGRPQPSASASPVGPWPWVRALLPGAIAPNVIRVRTEPWRLRRTTEVAWLSGSCIAAPTDVLRELGGFDSSIELFAEDMDLCLRAKDAGIQSFFAPDVATIVHDGDVSMSIRFEDHGIAAAVASERAVLERRYGRRAAAQAFRAVHFNLALRVAAKTILRSPTRERDARTLAALRGFA
jgi:N-acetylglucosaminyl-diphospho-decaprenol L-rhamnosyltransferase